ncbi:MAG: insulinase family protein, partial [Elusimicrobia bacterium]|nr:insulinase family protein [Elusimicrobiota bacterium]
MTLRRRALRALLAASLSFGPLLPAARAAAPDIDLSPPAFVPPDAQRTVLSNGVVVYLVENHELPIVDVQVWFKTSPMDDVPEHALRLFGPVWRSGGTLTRKPDALDDELESLAIKVETGADYESAGCSMSCLSRDITKALDLWTDVLLHPAFDSGRLAIEKGEQIEEIRRRNDTPQKIGRRAFRRVIYGPDHPYAKSPQPNDVTRVSRAELQKIHKSIIVPQTAIIAAAGDFDSKLLIEGLEKRFAGWTAGPPRKLDFDYSIKKPVAGKIFFVQKDSPQTRLSIGQVGISRLDPDRFAVTVGDYIFGGGGPSRLFGEIRSRLGLAYMVGSFVFDPTGPGMIGVVCQSKVQSTVAVTEAILKEMKKFSSEPVKD